MKNLIFWTTQPASNHQLTHISLQEYSRKPNWVIHIAQLTFHFRSMLNFFLFSFPDDEEPPQGMGQWNHL